MPHPAKHYAAGAGRLCVVLAFAVAAWIWAHRRSQPVSDVNNQPGTGPLWLDVARKYIGTREIPGSRHNSTILRWWRLLKAPFADDETSWCGAFVGGVLAECGLPIVDGPASARNWLKLPVKLDRPAVGCVVVFWRGSPASWTGHVGFVVGRDQAGNLMVLGGNQSDEVNIKPFPRDRVLGYRWPSKWPAEKRFDLPIIRSDGRVSTNEA